MFVLNLLLICVIFKSVCPQACNTMEDLGNIRILDNGRVVVCVLNEDDDPVTRRACSDNWDRKESLVACRSSDYPGVVSDGRPTNSQSLGIIFTCEGTELNLSKCKYSTTQEMCFRLRRLECQLCSDYPCPTTGVCNSDNKCDCIKACQNGGYCQAGICICPSGFNGDSCELCPKCQNGGTCLSDGTCECSSPFYGDYCENELCDPPCKNNGTCINGACNCSSPFYGDYCENEPCDPPCKNNGTCINGACNCSSPFYGDYCENESCDLPCQNNGTCINGACKCIYLFYGKSCQYCPKCRNGGTCILSEKLCNCAPGYTGKNCENITCQPECSDKQICNNGSCECPFGSSGTNCEQPSKVPSVITTNTKSTEDKTSKSRQTITLGTRSATQYGTNVSSNTISPTNSVSSDPGALAASSILYAAPAVVIIIILILAFLVILLLILYLSRFRKNKANATVDHAQNPQDIYCSIDQSPRDLNCQSSVDPFVQLDCCIYEELQQSLNTSVNPYLINNTLVNTTPFDNPLFSHVIEHSTDAPNFNSSTSFENPMYGELCITSNADNDLYQTYEKASQCPYTGSSIIVPRSDMRSLTNEVVYTSFDAHFSNPPTVENETTSTYFNQEDIYWEPPKNLGLLFNQMSEKRFREINRSAVELQDQIGSGQFGQVYKALWHTSGDQCNPFAEKGTLPVAVKTLHNQSTTELKTAFIQEAAIMGQFSHPNVLRLLGIVSRTEPFMIVTELMHMELLELLLTIRNSSIQRSHVLSLLLEFSRQIASGMTYLSSKSFIHRDLAARNVLVANDLTCRISDFGMSRQLREEGDYYTSKGGGKVPLKWTSPEAIFYQRYSEKSDVWSFGMTLYEIWTLGEKPWSNYSNDRVLEAFSNSEVMDQPKECPAGIWSVMLQCWEPTQELRPTFEQISELLSVSDSTLLDELLPIEK